MKTRTLLLLAALCTVPLALRAQQSTMGEGDSYAWAGNIGWIELTPHRPSAGDGVRVTDTHLSGYAWSDSTGWINFGDGTPANNIRYANTVGTDSGVNHDGAGNLRGLAWSANLGWINFGWAASNDPNRPRFALYGGGFTGYAWSASAGWINLGSGWLKTDTMVVADTDGDGISDSWERERILTSYPGGEIIPDLSVLTATGDADGDGYSDKKEYILDTNPFAGGDWFRVLSITPVVGGTELVWTSRPTRVYQFLDSLNLTSWTPNLAGIMSPDAGAQTTRNAFTPPGPSRFFQVQALVPLQP